MNRMEKQKPLSHARSLQSLETQRNAEDFSGHRLARLWRRNTDLRLKSGRQRLREEGMSNLLPLLRRRCLHPEAPPLDPRSAWISSFKQYARQDERDSHESVMDCQIPIIKSASSDLLSESRCCGSREAAEQSECKARKHEEEEVGKASSLEFTASDSLCRF